MRIIQLTDSAEGAPLVAAEAQRPQPASAELLIKVHAAGVTPTELMWYPTTHTKDGGKRTGAVPGHEFSGVVAGLGSEVSSFEPGQAVFGMNDWFSEGATAEYCIAPFASVAPKPTCLTHNEAASVPIGGLTAWQGLFDHGKLQAGQTVLVHGGAGAVGVYAIQLARIHGARVIATASAHNLDFMSSLGAELVVDYHAERFEDRARDADLVFDTVGGETLARSWAFLKPGGRVVTIAATEVSSDEVRAKQSFFIVEPNQKQLIKIAELLEKRELQPVVDAVVPLTEAPRAYKGEVKRRGRGKLVVEVAA